jgi:hypothetical protein
VLEVAGYAGMISGDCRDAAHIPAGIVHATFNASKADATILAILSPGASKGPFMVDVSGEAPWNQLRGPT